MATKKHKKNTKKSKKVEMCSHCGKNPATKPNLCPFAIEMGHSTGKDNLCNCCDDCRRQCAEDV